MPIFTFIKVFSWDSFFQVLKIAKLFSRQLLKE